MWEADDRPDDVCSNRGIFLSVSHKRKRDVQSIVFHKIGGRCAVHFNDFCVFLDYLVSSESRQARL